MKILLTTIVLATLLATAAPAGAVSGINQLKNNLGIIGTKTGLGTQGDANLPQKIAAIINIALGFVALIAVIMIIYAGFKWITAGGNEETVKEARGNIRNAVIGIVVIMLSYAIINFVVSQVSDATGAGGGGGGGREDVIAGPGSCIYDFSGCNQLCVNIIDSACTSTYPWPNCGAAGGTSTGNLTSQLPGLCSATCPGCSSL